MARVPLPPRRLNVTQKFKIISLDDRGKNPTLYVTVGFSGMVDDGKPREVKIVLSNTGSNERAYTDALSYVVSIGLQNGVELADLVEQFLTTKFEPYGPVTGYKYIKFCSSPLDLAFRWLAIKYCQMWDLAVLEPNEQVNTDE
jgi:hypothetical protein